MHHALAILADKLDARAVIDIDIRIVILAIVIRFIIVTVTVVLTTGLSLGTATTADLSWILLVPALFLLGWRLDDTNQETPVHLIKLVRLLHGTFKEEEVFFGRLVL